MKQVKVYFGKTMYSGAVVTTEKVEGAHTVIEVEGPGQYTDYIPPQNCGPDGLDGVCVLINNNVYGVIGIGSSGNSLIFCAS